MRRNQQSSLYSLRSHYLARIFLLHRRSNHPLLKLSKGLRHITCMPLNCWPLTLLKTNQQCRRYKRSKKHPQSTCLLGTLSIVLLHFQNNIPDHTTCTIVSHLLLIRSNVYQQHTSCTWTSPQLQNRSLDDKVSTQKHHPSPGMFLQYTRHT